MRKLIYILNVTMFDVFFESIESMGTNVITIIILGYSFFLNSNNKILNNCLMTKYQLKIV